MVSEKGSTKGVEKYQVSVIGNYFISREVKRIAYCFKTFKTVF